MRHVAATTTATTTRHKTEKLTIKGIDNAEVKVESRWIRLQERIASARIDYALKVPESWISRFGMGLR